MSKWRLFNQRSLKPGWILPKASEPVEGWMRSREDTSRKKAHMAKELSSRGERERLFGSRERERKLKITFPFYGKGTGIRKCYGKGREI